MIMTREERRIENKRIYFEQKIRQSGTKHRLRIRKLEKMINKMYDSHQSAGRAEALYSGLSKVVNNLDKRIKRLEH